MPDRAVAGSAVTLPERVTVLTCIGCGAMGRQEGCADGCSEHRLVLVEAAHHDGLRDLARAARVRADRWALLVRALAEADAEPADARDALLALQARVRAARREAGPRLREPDREPPTIVTGWWCAACGNVDLPQPCIGVCVWRPADWVSLAGYERALGAAERDLRTERSLGALLDRVGAVTPRPGQWEANWQALRRQARTALEASEAPAAPGGR